MGEEGKDQRGGRGHVVWCALQGAADAHLSCGSGARAPQSSRSQPSLACACRATSTALDTRSLRMKAFVSVLKNSSTHKVLYRAWSHSFRSGVLECAQVAA